MDAGAGARKRTVAVAGHTGDAALARTHLGDADSGVRAMALGALHRCGALQDTDLAAALRDPHPTVRRRAAELGAHYPAVTLLGALADAEPLVAEMAAWACGEREPAEAGAVTALAALTTRAPDPLVREAAVAALGAIGDAAGLAAVLEACADRAAVRRRAVLALAAFDGDDVRAALARARHDRDWQVRQSAEDLLAIIEGHHRGPED